MEKGKINISCLDTDVQVSSFETYTNPETGKSGYKVVVKFDSFNDFTVNIYGIALVDGSGAVVRDSSEINLRSEGFEEILYPVYKELYFETDVEPQNMMLAIPAGHNTYSDWHVNINNINN